MERGLRPHALARVHIDAENAAIGEDTRPMARRHPHLGHCIEIGDRNVGENIRVAHDHRLVVLEGHFAGDEADGGGKFVLFAERLWVARNFGRVEFGKGGRASPQPDADADRTDFLFERDDGVALAIDHRHAQFRQQRRGAEGRMTGKRNFADRREDPHLGGVARARRRHHEHGLRQIEFPGDGLHFRNGEPVRVEHDRQWIAAKGALGEDVENVIGQCH